MKSLINAIVIAVKITTPCEKRKGRSLGGLRVLESRPTLLRTSQKAVEFCRLRVRLRIGDLCNDSISPNVFQNVLLLDEHADKAMTTKECGVPSFPVVPLDLSLSWSDTHM